MPKFRVLATLTLTTLTSPCWADSFDDAVNLYLKGVEQCIAAKEELASRNLPAAQRAFRQYESIKAQAIAIDSRIESSSQRGMSSNLKFCKRIGNDIELANGTPLLEKGMAACDQAFDALKANTPDVATAHFQEYTQYRDQALEVAPGLTDVFSLKSDIRRCNRLENKIAKSGQQQAMVTQLLESATDESEALLNGCLATSKEFNEGRLNRQTLDSAAKSITKIEGYRKNTQEYYTAYLEKEPAGNKTVSSNLNKGDQCIATFKKTYTDQQRKWDSQISELERQQQSLSTANQQCASISKLSAAGPDKARHSKAKSQYEAARSARNTSTKALASNQAYTANPDSSLARKIDGEIGKLNQCLKSANKQVAALLPPVVAAAPIAKAAVPAPAALVAAPVAATKVAAKTVNAAATPAAKLTGTLTINDTLPDLAILYWDDGKPAQDSGSIKLYSTGFSKSVYVLPDDGQLQIENSDFAQHKLSYSDGSLDTDKPLLSLGSKQKKVANITLPDNTLSVIRSNKNRVNPSYLVKASSSDIKILQFEGGSNTLELDLKNLNSATGGYLLLPDMAPVAFTLSKGQDNTIELIRNNNKVGTLVLKGL